jgi:hypothetical protein
MLAAAIAAAQITFDTFDMISFSATLSARRRLSYNTANSSRRTQRTYAGAELSENSSMIYRARARERYRRSVSLGSKSETSRAHSMAPVPGASQQNEAAKSIPSSERRARTSRTLEV